MGIRRYVAAVAATLLLPAGGAHAAGLEPQGRKCAFNSTTDITGEAGYQTGDANFGPLVLSEPGTVECVVYRNDTVATTLAGHSAGAGAVEVAAGAGTIRYAGTAADEIDLCTVVRYDSGATVWWKPDPLAQPGGGGWRTGPVDPYWCGTRLQIPEGQECSVLLAVDQRAGTRLADIWQDCEPYEPII